MVSMPFTRAISSMRSTSRLRSERQLGVVTFQSASSERSRPQPRRSSVSAQNAARHPCRAAPRYAEHGNAGAGLPTAWAPACRHLCGHAAGKFRHQADGPIHSEPGIDLIHTALKTVGGFTGQARRRAVLRMVSGRNTALSTTTLRLASEISVLSRP